MFAFVGLGNPGSSFEGTRHNIGFDVVDALARSLKTSFRPGRGEYYYATGGICDEELVLVKPTTYMNNSGEAVVQVIGQYHLDTERTVVICDDFQLPLGTLRLRTSGSDGGHNGLYSIIYHLGSLAFPRLRCGIGSPHLPMEKSLAARFVLDVFAEDERERAAQMVKRAQDACCSVVCEGFDKTMSMYNSTSAQ